MNFEEYWNAFGDLHADMCKGDIKVFAKEVWKSAQGNVFVEIDSPRQGPPGEKE